jgi:hypothetical protein
VDLIVIASRDSPEKSLFVWTAYVGEDADHFAGDFLCSGRPAFNVCHAPPCRIFLK